MLYRSLWLKASGIRGMLASRSEKGPKRVVSRPSMCKNIEKLLLVMARRERGWRPFGPERSSHPWH